MGCRGNDLHSLRPPPGFALHILVDGHERRRRLLRVRVGEEEVMERLTAGEQVSRAKEMVSRIKDEGIGGSDAALIFHAAFVLCTDCMDKNVSENFRLRAIESIQRGLLP